MSDSELRLSCFLLALLICLLLEYFFAWREVSGNFLYRLGKHVGIIFLGTLLSKLLLPLGLVGAASYAEIQGWGLLRLYDGIPASMIFLGGFLLLDFLIYCQHVISHKWPLLWRLHRVHHSDLHVDVTTALRFHPFEIALSTFYKLFFIVVLGLPAMLVFVFELVLNSLAMFNHSNIKITPGLNSLLSKVIVTPSMHRVHHSQVPAQADSNYGFCLVWWDVLFKTRIHVDNQALKLGLKESSQHRFSFIALLLMPFRD